MSTILISLLGTPFFETNKTRLNFKRQKSVALLSYLAATGEASLRPTLAALLWPNSTHLRAQDHLRHVIFDLRQVLGQNVIQTTGNSIALVPNLIKCDLTCFCDSLSQYSAHEKALDKRHSPTPQILAPLIEAVTSVRGEFMAGFSLANSILFDQWQTQQSGQIQQELRWAYERLITGLTELQEYEKAIHHAVRALEMDPLNEKSHRSLMQLYLLTHQRELALRQYETCKEWLGRELNLSPQPETTAVYQTILAGEVSNYVSNQGNTHAPIHVGETHIQAVFSPPVMIPAPSTSFCGRENEITYLYDRLQNPACRLVSILGMGGSGKTRLALAIGQKFAGNPHHLQQHFPDGMFFVGLDSLTGPDQIFPSLAEILGLSTHQDPKKAVLEHLKSRNLLFILDNFEPFVSEARLVTELLTISPGIKILITSRERLALQEEECFEIAGLTYPEKAQTDLPLEMIETFPAVQLLLQRAHRAYPHLKLNEDNSPWMIKLCSLLDGWPLALELAAEALRKTSLPQLVETLTFRFDFLQTTSRNLPTRHQSLHAIFTHSWDALTSEEQDAYARLSVFQGGFKDDAAQALGISAETFYSLHDKSLFYLKQTERFEIHPVLKQFASEKLSENHAVFRETSLRYCTYYLRLLARSHTSLKNSQQIATLKSLSSDKENLHLA